MQLLFIQIGIFCVGGLGAALFHNRPQKAASVAAICAGIGCCLGLGLALTIISQQTSSLETFTFPLPLGLAQFKLDPLAAFFLAPIGAIGAIASVLLYRERSLLNPNYLWKFSFFFCLLLASLSLVLTAADVILFLLLWEIMSVCPFFLMRDKNKAAYGAWLYLIIAHLGVLPLFLLFGSLAVETGTTTFASIANHAILTGWSAPGLLFCLALVGFGAKMGLFPLHSWMPEAYSILPTPAVMVIAGTMSNMGIYGLVRSINLIGMPENWWGILLMAAGAVSGLIGIYFAFVQPNIKRILGYSSSENMGIICLALGAAILASNNGHYTALALLSGGALLHIWNHSLYKSLLFLGANTIERMVGSTRISQLGGLAKKMPNTAVTMAIGCAAIAAVPPFNGFISELLLFVGFADVFRLQPNSDTVIFFWLGLVALGGIGGFALFCFTRLYGIVFLGAPRSQYAEHIQPVDAITASRKHILAVLASTCLLFTLIAPFLYTFFAPVQQYLVLHLSPMGYLPKDATGMGFPLTILCWAATSMLILGVIILLVYLWRKRLNAIKHARQGITWDCAYTRPTPRIQYTGGSFSHTGMVALHPFLRSNRNIPQITDLFAKPTTASVETKDWTISAWGKGLFALINSIATLSKRFQHGYINLYILYVLIALIVTLIWTLGKI